MNLLNNAISSEAARCFADSALQNAEAVYGRYHAAQVREATIRDLAEILQTIKTKDVAPYLAANFEDFVSSFQRILNQSEFFKDNKTLIAFMPHLAVSCLKNIPAKVVGNSTILSRIPAILERSLCSLHEKRPASGDLAQGLKDLFFSELNGELQQLPVASNPSNVRAIILPEFNRLAKPTLSAKEKLNLLCSDLASRNKLLPGLIYNNQLKNIFAWRFVADKSTANVSVDISFKGSLDLERNLPSDFDFSRGASLDPTHSFPDWRYIHAYGSRHNIRGALNSSNNQALNAALSITKSNDLLGTVAFQFSEPDYRPLSGTWPNIREWFSRVRTESSNLGKRSNLSIIFIPPRELEQISDDHRRIDQRAYIVQLNINMSASDARQIKSIIQELGADAVLYDFIRAENEKNLLGQTVTQWLRSHLFTPLLNRYQELLVQNQQIDRDQIWKEVREGQRQAAFSKYAVCDLDDADSIAAYKKSQYAAKVVVESK